jgi:dTDP-4-dehydrorhamnose 3,5-epimerase
VQFRELKIAGAWEITPRLFGDPRGVFLEVFKHQTFDEAVGHPFTLKQVNSSVSEAGVVRGIHFAEVPPSQAKYVTCTRGAVLDVVVDIRVGSPTFGAWDAVLLDDLDRRSIYISEGLGHAFCSLEDDSTVVYLCSEPYAPGREHGVSPLCPTVGIRWPTTGRNGEPLTLKFSEKDAQAPDLRGALDQGILPSYEDVNSFVASLRP